MSNIDRKIGPRGYDPYNHDPYALDLGLVINYVQPVTCVAELFGTPYAFTKSITREEARVKWPHAD